MNGPDDIYTFAYLEGAFMCVTFGFLVLAAVLVLLAHWRESRLWRRFVRTCGSEKSAMAVLEAAEALPTDFRMTAGMASAQRRGWLQSYRERVARFNEETHR